MEKNKIIKNKISAALITYNEEVLIEATLKKLTWCDEIIVIDSNSSDKTVELCKKYNAKVYTKTFNGYGEQKRFMVDHTNNDWVLSIDADEVLTNKLITEIQTELIAPKFNVYTLNRRHVFLGKVFNYGKLKNESIIRLFNKNNAAFTNNKVHEKIITKSKIGKLDNHFLHYTVATIEEVKEKEDKYSTIYANESFKKNKKVSLFKMLFKYPFDFIKHYFIYLNFLNGKEGFIWSTSNARSGTMKLQKLRRLYKKN